ncbi:MAG: HemK family protein methyltransferase, partial [Thermoleophilia bacterium]
GRRARGGPEADEAGGAEGEAAGTDGAAPPAPLIADVGTGSGAIALTLASEAGVRMLAIDSSDEALAVAAENREALALEALVELRLGDLLEGVAPGSLRVVVSNPPYVSEPEFAGLAPDVCDFEPAAALVAGDDGLSVYRRLVPQAYVALGPGGALFLEVGDTQAPAVRDLAVEAGFVVIDATRDLSGKERIVRAIKGGAPVVDGARLADEGGREALLALRATLERGGVIGLPTDTVYGLAAAWTSEAGVRGLLEAKGRGEERPVAALFSSVAAVKEALPDLEPAAARVLEALLPGPYTFVVATRLVRPRLVGTEDSLGVRVPDHRSLLRLLADLGIPLVATSANRSGGPDVAGLAEADPSVMARCAVALVFDAPAVGTASTVVDLRPLASGEVPVVLREGAVPAAEVFSRIAAAR